MVEKMERWNILKVALIDKGYSLYQFQYSYDMDEGFNAWFCKIGKSDTHVITHNESVQKDIIYYNEKTS